MRTIPTALLMAMLTLPVAAALDPDVLGDDVDNVCVYATPLLQELPVDPGVTFPLRWFLPDLDQCVFPVEAGPDDLLAGPGAPAPITGLESGFCSYSADGTYSCVGNGQEYYVHVLGIFFEHVNYQGANFGIIALSPSTQSPCVGNSRPAFAMSVMPSGWNERVSSVYSACNVHLFQHEGYRGRDAWCWGSNRGCTQLTTQDFNDRTSSFKIW